MGCMSEAHYYVREGSLVREMRIYERGRVASESLTLVPLAHLAT